MDSGEVVIFNLTELCLIYLILAFISTPIKADYHASLPKINAPTDQQSSNQANSDIPDTGLWVIDPAQPGPDLPPVGMSLFDLIFSINGTHQVAYPFPALLKHLGSHLAAPDHSLKQVLIPHGRSLRHEAVAPDYFLFPRFIVAAEGEPMASTNDAGLLLKSRLFIAYQEKTKLLEVISYNPEAGRFEFQEVQNYGLGLVPRVSYANRVLCLSCHQNAGPIFPLEPWRETDANIKIAARLRAVKPSLPTKSIYAPRFEDAWAIDYASDRATYFSSSQFIWSKGCGSSAFTPTVESTRCRAAMLLAVLQYRLIGAVQLNSLRYKTEFLPVISRIWQELWPKGLNIATADIPDRDPFLSISNAIQSPLTLRPPRAFWATPQPHLLEGIIRQLAEFLGEADIRRIDEHLYRNAQVQQIPKTKYESSCTLARKNEREAIRIEFSCSGSTDSTGSDFDARGFLHIQNNKVIGGRMRKIGVAGYPDQLYLSLARGRIEQNGDKRTIILRIMANKTGIGVKHDTSGLGARLDDGTLLEQLKFSWSGDQEQRLFDFPAQGQLTTLNDLKPLDTAIEHMAQQASQAQADALSSKPFRRRSVIKALYKSLGMAPLSWRQDEVATVSMEISDSKAVTSAVMESSDSFARYCSACHSGAGKFPPGFLHGSSDQIMNNLSRCRQKIMHRLGMWHLDPAERSVSPMPPAHWLSALGFTESEWQQSTSLTQLIAATRLQPQNRSDPADTTSSLCQ